MVPQFPVPQLTLPLAKRQCTVLWLLQSRLITNSEPPLAPRKLTQGTAEGNFPEPMGNQQVQTPPSTALSTTITSFTCHHWSAPPAQSPNPVWSPRTAPRSTIHICPLYLPIPPFPQSPPPQRVITHVRHIYDPPPSSSRFPVCPSNPLLNPVSRGRTWPDYTSSCQRDRDCGRLLSCSEQRQVCLSNPCGPKPNSCGCVASR